jgi:hypothetical protein
MSAAPLLDVAERQTCARFPAVDHRRVGIQGSMTVAA